MRGQARIYPKEISSKGKINKQPLSNPTMSNKYTGTPFEPYLNYERDFDPEKKAPTYIMLVECG